MSPAHEKHQDLLVICDRIHRVILANDAQALLNDESTLPARATVRIMPSWDWRLPLIDMGRKQLDDKGNPTLLMPIRLSWEGSAIQVSEAQLPGEVAGHAIGLGHEHPISSTTFEALKTDRLSRSQLVSRLKGIIEDGNLAIWEQMISMDSQINKTVMRAHASVSKEIANSGHEEESVLDEIDLQGIIATLTLGDEAEPGERQKKSSFYRMIALLTQPGAFRSVDPIMFMSVHLRRDAQSAIRKRLDDPHVGPKVRQLSREFPELALSDFVKEYNLRYPHDHLSPKRAMRALTVKPAPHARRISAVEDYHLSQVESRYEEVEEHSRHRVYAWRRQFGRVA